MATYSYSAFHFFTSSVSVGTNLLGSEVIQRVQAQHPISRLDQTSSIDFNQPPGPFAFNRQK